MAARMRGLSAAWLLAAALLAPGAAVRADQQKDPGLRSVSGPLADDMAACVREAMSNVVRHASGAATRVELAHTGEAVTLRVSNEAPPPTRANDVSPTGGHGLVGMRERAVMLGGHLTAGPTQSGGFEVRAELPTRPATS